MGKGAMISLCLLLVSLYGSEAHASRGPVEMGDIKAPVSRKKPIVFDLKETVGLEDGEVNDLDDELSAPSEEDTFSRSAGDAAESFVQTDSEGEKADQSEEDEAASDMDGEEDEDAESAAGPSFMEGQHAASSKDLADSDPSELGEDSEEQWGDMEGEDSEDEEPASFLQSPLDSEDPEDYEVDGADNGEDEEDEYEPEANTAVDPYINTASAVASRELSYVEEAAENKGKDQREAQPDTQQPQEEEDADASFSEMVDKEDQSLSASFVQLLAKKDIYPHTTERAASSFVQAVEPPLEASDQTAAEDEMLREAGANVEGPEPSGEDMPLEDAPSEGGGMLEEGAGPGQDMKPEDEALKGDIGGSRGAFADEGQASESLEAPEGTALNAEPGEEVGREQDSLQLRAEEAGEHQEEMPPTTEDELAADLQGSFPKIEAAQPHVVRRRHVDQDIRMTEALRTEGKTDIAKSESSLTVVWPITLLGCTVWMFL